MTTFMSWTCKMPVLKLVHKTITFYVVDLVHVSYKILFQRPGDDPLDCDSCDAILVNEDLLWRSLGRTRR